MEKLTACARQLGITLNPEQIEQFSLYYAELIEWNTRFNLTAITGHEEVQIKHFCDSLTAVLAFKLPEAGKPFRVLDVGTGAGFPGVPLKIALPEISLTLLESTAKKATFLQHLKEKLRLPGLEIVIARAEEAGHERQYREQFDIVLSRAVAALPALAELCLPFCRIGGVFIAQKKGDISGEVARAKRAVELMGGLVHEIKKIELDELADDRCLVIIDKVSPTPATYPRRPGMPANRPIL